MDKGNTTKLDGQKFTRGGSTHDSRMLWASQGIKGKGSSDKLDPIFSKIGEEIWGAPNNGPGIFQSVNPATWFEANPQKVIEDLMGLKPGQDVFMMDFENVGTFRGKNATADDWYSPTELAIGHRKVAQDYTLQKTKDSKEISMLLKPLGEDLSRIDDLIEKVKTGQSLKFTPDQWRTLNDLILYGHDDPFNAGYFRAGKDGITYLDKQLRDRQAPDGFIFNKGQIDRMIVGRNNLLNHGATPDQIIMQMDAMFGNSGNIKIGGYNVDKYDVPLMLDYVNNRLGKHVQDPKARKALERLQNTLSTAKSLDTFQMVKSLYKDHSSRFGKNLKQENLADILPGISKGTSHMALDDLNTSAEIHNFLVNDLSKEAKLQLGWNVTNNMMHGKTEFGATWNSTPYNVGQSVFSLSGIAGDKSGKYDMVYRIEKGKGKKNKTGMLVPAYGDMRPNPLFKNTEYKINRIFTKEVNGQKMHGTILENIDDGLFHVIMRDDENDLKNFFQQHLVATDDLMPGDQGDLKKVTSWDRARRRWDRLFSSDGSPAELRAMMNGAQLIQNSNGNVSDAALQKALTIKGKGGKTRQLGPSALRDLKVIAPRLNAEREYIGDFLNQLDGSTLSDKGKGVALSHFRKNMDAEFGENTSSISTGSSKVWQTKVDGESHIISLRNSTSIQAGVSRAVRAGHVGAPSIGVVKRRLLEMTNQLYAKGPTGFSSTQKQVIIKQINQLREGDSYNTLLTEIAGRLEEAVRYEDDTLKLKPHLSPVLGQYSMTVEDPTKLNDKRKQRMEDPTHGYANKKQLIAHRSLNSATALDSYAWTQDYKIDTKDKFFQQILKDHDDAMAVLAKHTRANESQLSMMSAKDTLSRLASAFVDDDIAATYIWDDKHKGLVLALANKKQAEAIFKLTPNEILENQKVAKINVGLLNKGKLTIPGQERMANLVVMNRGNQTYLGSTVDKITDSVIRSRASIKEKILGNDVLGATSQAKNIVTRASENLMLNISQMSQSGKEELRRYDQKKSALIEYTRSGFIDMSGFAPELYQDIYGESKYKQKTHRMNQDRSLSFIDTLNSEEMKAVNQQMGRFAKNKYGLKVNTNNVKDVHAMNMIRSAESVDMRSFSPFGYYTPMARENIMKSGGYQALDRQATREGLLKSFSTKQVDRMLNSALVTDAYKTTAGSELGYLNLRAAYVDSNQLNDMMRQNLKGVDATASTYEGTVILHEDVAKSISTQREKKIRFASGADPLGVIDSKIIDFFEQHGEKDDYGNWMLKETTSIVDADIKRLGLGVDNTHGSAKKGQITVGTLMRDEHVRESYGYGSNADFSYLKGFNVEKGELIIGEMYNLQTGDKMLSAGGLRVTPIIKKKDWFQQMKIDAQIVVPEAEMKKEQFGSFLNSRVSMTVQEAMDNGKITVGNLTKEQVISNLMETHFGVEKDSLKFIDNQVIMPAMQGVAQKRVIKLDDLHRFMEEATTLFNLDKEKMLNSKIQYGQESMAVGDVYRWQNSFGRTYSVDKESGKILNEGGEGLVRWGLKDQGAIASAADHVARLNNKPESAVVNWLQDHVNTVARVQNTDIDKFAKALMRSVNDHTDQNFIDGKVGKGEVVINTRGDAFGFSGQYDEHGTLTAPVVIDREGRKTARRTADGVTQVSLHAFDEVLPLTQEGQTRTVADYQRTVVNMKGVDVDIYGHQGKIDESLQQLLHDNGGTSLFQLPDDSFNGRKHVRFLDSRIAQIALDESDDMAVLEKLQMSQVQIAKHTKAYQADPTLKNRNRILSAINEHDAQTKYLFESSRSGSLSDKLMSAKLDMSGRFTVQTLNPLESGKYKEATMVVSRDRMAEMVNGAESNILETLDKKTYDQMNADWQKSVTGKNLSEVDALVQKNEFMRESALAQIEEKGLYGFVNRYPTIHETTHQVLNIQIGKDLPTELHKSRTAFLTVGTATIMNADSDGDFMSSVLAQYKSKNAKALHDEMSQIHSYNVAEHEEYARYMRQDIEKEATKRNTTVQDLWRDDEFRKGWTQEWMPRVGEVFDRETDIARFGKGDVGVLDNMRLKLSNLGAGVWTSVAKSVEGLDVRTRLQQLDEFGRLVSQKAISSKKFSIASITEQIQSEGINLQGDALDAEINVRMNRREDALNMLREGIQEANSGGIDKIKRANNVLDIFKLGEMDNKKWNVTDQKFTFNSMLDTLQETYQVYGNQRGWLNNPFLKAGVSEGQSDIRTASEMLKGRGGMAIPTPFVRGLMAVDNGFAENMQTPIENFENTMVSNFKRVSGMERSFDGLMGSTSEYMGRDMTGLASNVDKSSGSTMMKLARDFASGLGGGGAVGFKSVQAGMAVFGGLWATSAAMRSGPTPEQTARTEDGGIQDVPIKGLMSQPTARVTPNKSGEQINIQISSSQASKMNHQQIAAMVQQEMSAMMPMQLNMNMNVNDNTQNLNQQWLQGVVAQAMSGRII